MRLQNKNGKNGHCNMCRECTKAYRQTDGYKAASRARGHKDYTDPVKREAQKARMREYRKRPEVIEMYARYKKEHEKEIGEKRRKWRKDHIFTARERECRSMAKWMSNPRNRFSNVMSRDIAKSLSKGAKGRNHWEKLVPYTLDDLIKHIETLWEPGMNWSNHKKDGWHIDHIRPISAFSFDKPIDQGFRDCWALSNLMPRWATTAIAQAHGSEQIGNANKSSKLPETLGISTTALPTT